MWVWPALVAGLLLQAPAPGADAPVARVGGVVLKGDSGGPVSRAAVRLTGPTGEAREAVSDLTGRFEFSALGRGHYLLAVSKAGYVSTVKDLEVTSSIRGLQVRLSKGGAIVGRILDEEGEPVVEARVRALRSEYLPGGRRLTARHTVQTNDLGEYRLYGLPPGIYYVVASTSKFDLEGYDPEKQAIVTRGGPGFAPTFFPGSAVAADAQPVNVRAGTDVPGIDFALKPVRLARLSGVVVDSHGRPATLTVVMLNPARTGGAAVTTGIFDMSYTEAGADGSFVLSNVRPGEYRLDAYNKAAIEAIAQSGGVGRAQATQMAEYASAPVAVTGDDVESLRIVTTPGRLLAGRITVDGGAPTPATLDRLKVWTVDRTAGLSISVQWSGAAATVFRDGTFEVRGVSGVRKLDVYGLPQGWALKSVRAGGVDVTEEGIEIRDSDVTDLELTLTARPAGVSGVVVDEMNRPVANHGVIIFAEDRQRWSSPPNRHVVSATTDEDGSFKVTPLPAADYFVAVVPELIDGEWAEAGNLERLRGAAQRITIAEGETKVLTLRR